jgi:hypothetical protein
MGIPARLRRERAGREKEKGRRKTKEEYGSNHLNDTEERRRRFTYQWQRGCFKFFIFKSKYHYKKINKYYCNRQSDLRRYL